MAAMSKGQPWQAYNRRSHMLTRDDEPIRLVCPKCRSRLEVLETTSGARTVSVIGLGDSVGSTAKALETFVGPDAGPDVACPACGDRFDPASPYRGTQRRR
jgi:DNA-directed RNA polymerase subunit RPC12/RpoP